MQLATHRSVRHATVLAVAALAVVAGCTRDGEDAIGPADTTAPTSVVTSTAPPTTAPPTTAPPTTVPVTTAPPTTAPVVTTTTPPPTTAPPTTAPPTTPPPPPAPAPIVLRSDGIGRFGFGAAAADVVNGVLAELGAPATDVRIDYPVPTMDGFATDTSGEEVFRHPYGRTACFANGLCVQFGGGVPDGLVFVGWEHVGGAPPVLATPSGVTAGTRWSDAPGIAVDAGGCFSAGTGQIDGVLLSLVSEGAPFGEFAADGSPVVGSPAPADVRVTRLEAGSLPFMPFVDC